MRVGIVGFPGCGKSTVFQALAPGAPGSKGGVTYGNIKVPDERVDALAKIFNPKKTTFAEITFLDVSETGKAAKGAFSPEVIQEMRNADVLVHVVRAFDNPMLGEPIDPQAEVQAFDDEILLIDMALLERAVERMIKEQKKGLPLDVRKKCLEHLEGGEPLRNLELTAEEEAELSAVQLLSRSPLVRVFNLSEETWEDPEYASLKPLKGPEGNAVSLGLCAAIESEIAQLETPEEQAEFLESLGLEAPAKIAFVKAAYQLLDLISFLTSGEDECRAWSIARGTIARAAAGKIHSDIERGFIRAEVYRLEDLLEAGTEAALKKAGKMRLEGKEYVVQDGDVMHFRFNV
ncbi:MAG: DUF933 domain-containing protein [Deltaproteobacteria bacterium]|nr:DUF933 domain-containing protein [Deltaproteobacteria bacterium]